MNPYLIVAILLALIASHFGVGKWQNNVGRESERVEWLKKDNNSLIAANATIARLNKEARDKEKEHVDAVTLIATNYAAGYEALEARRRADARAAASGAFGLRIPASACASVGSAPAEAGTPARRSDGPATVELPREVTADLLALANDADQVADQLRACQQVIVSDRKGSP